MTKIMTKTTHLILDQPTVARVHAPDDLIPIPRIGIVSMTLLKPTIDLLTVEMMSWCHRPARHLVHMAFTR
jgi:hypothetical protein